MEGPGRQHEGRTSISDFLSHLPGQLPIGTKIFKRKGERAVDVIGRLALLLRKETPKERRPKERAGAPFVSQLSLGRLGHLSLPGRDQQGTHAADRDNSRKAEAHVKAIFTWRSLTIAIRH
jgi:hypothetical protein